MRRPIVLALLVLAPRLVAAQILSLPSNRTDAGNWIGAGASRLNFVSMRDDSRGAVWNVGEVIAYRVSIDKSYGSGATLGATITWSNPSMTINTNPTGVCPAGCAASANFQHYQLTYRSGETRGGTAPVAELAVGGLRVSDVRAGGTQVAPDRTLLTMGAGGGLAIATSSTFQFELVQEYTWIFAGGGFSGAATQWSTRLGVRVGFGNRD